MNKILKDVKKSMWGKCSISIILILFLLPLNLYAKWMYPKPTRFSQEWSGEKTQIKGPKITVIYNSKDWNKLWKSHDPTSEPPPIDFTSHMALGIFNIRMPKGLKDKGHHTIILCTEIYSKNILVTLKSGPLKMSGFHIVLVPCSKLPIDFEFLGPDPNGECACKSILAKRFAAPGYEKIGKLQKPLRSDIKEVTRAISEKGHIHLKCDIWIYKSYFAENGKLIIHINRMPDSKKEKDTGEEKELKDGDELYGWKVDLSHLLNEGKIILTKGKKTYKWNTADELDSNKLKFYLEK